MATEGDIKTQRATYEKMIGMFKYGGIVVLVIAFVVIWLISGK